MPREREQLLSSARLGELLDLYSEGVTMSFVGGSDVGAYFRFAGRAVGCIPAEVHIIGGRIVRPWGFLSEAIIPTRSEMVARDVPDAPRAVVEDGDILRPSIPQSTVERRSRWGDAAQDRYPRGL